MEEVESRLRYKDLVGTVTLGRWDSPKHNGEEQAATREEMSVQRRNRQCSEPEDPRTVATFGKHTQQKANVERNVKTEKHKHGV